MLKPITVSEYNDALKSGRWLEYATLEEATESVMEKAGRYRAFMRWEIRDELGALVATINGQH